MVLSDCLLALKPPAAAEEVSDYLRALNAAPADDLCVVPGLVVVDLLS